MKTHIKIYLFLVFAFVSINYSYGQTSNTTDSATQDNAGVVTDQQNSENAGSVPEKSDNELLNAIIENNNSPEPERVKGTRLPNEYASGRTGGQFNSSQNPATAKPNSNPNAGSTNQNSTLPNNNQNNGDGNTGGANQPPANTESGE